MSKGRDRPGKEKRKPKSDKNKKKKKKTGVATPAQTPGAPPKPAIAIAGKQI